MGMSHESKIRNWLLVGILVLAAGLRWSRFGDIPHGLNRDEAALGYTAYLLGETGRDEHGRRWPIRFESFGDWKQPVYIYLLIPVVKILGLSESAVRFPSFLAGLALIFSAFFIAKEILPKKYSGWGGLLAVLLLSFNPWHFHFSRLALEAMVASAFFSWAVWWLVRYREKRRVLVGYGLLVLTIFTYHAALVTVPLWLIGYLWWFRKKNDEGKLRLMGGILIFFLATMWFWRAWHSQERVKAVGTTIFQMTNEQKWEAIYRYRVQWWSSLWHNQYVYFLRTVGKNYLLSFQPMFLIKQGGSHPHYNLPGFGNFLWPEVVLTVIGCWWFFRQLTPKRKVMLWWLLVVPVAAAVTKDGVHSTREVFWLPVIQILAAAGAVALVRHWRWSIKQVVLVVSVVTVLAAFPFYQYYFGRYRIVSDERFFGYMKDVWLSLDKISEHYDKIYVTFPFESPYMMYAFYTKMSTDKFITQVQYWPVDEWGFRHVSQLGQLTFVPDTKDLISKHPDVIDRSLVISRQEEMPAWIRPLVVWDNLGNQPEVVAWEGNQL